MNSTDKQEYNQNNKQIKYPTNKVIIKNLKEINPNRKRLSQVIGMKLRSSVDLPGSFKRNNRKDSQTILKVD